MFLFFRYASACLAEILVKSPEYKLINSLGNDIEWVILVSFIDLDVLTKDFNSVNLSLGDFNSLNKEYIVVP